MLLNVSQGVTLAKSPRLALDMWTRARGMIGRKFDGFDALIFPSCSSVHTWFMGQRLDLIFVDRERRVLTFETEVSAWRFILGPRGACTVIELPPAALCGISMKRDDLLSW
jgi:uncharacterized membrane protein (UPF0127 family)